MRMVWPHSIEPEVRGSYGGHGMIKAATRESKAGANILRLQIEN
jgi:hypothetical protein